MPGLHKLIEAAIAVTTSKLVLEYALRTDQVAQQAYQSAVFGRSSLLHQHFLDMRSKDTEHLKDWRVSLGDMTNTTTLRAQTPVPRSKSKESGFGEGVWSPRAFFGGYHQSDYSYNRNSDSMPLGRERSRISRFYRSDPEDDVEKRQETLLSEDLLKTMDSDDSGKHGGDNKSNRDTSKDPLLKVVFQPGWRLRMIKLRAHLAKNFGQGLLPGQEDASFPSVATSFVWARCCDHCSPVSFTRYSPSTGSSLPAVSHQFNYTSPMGLQAQPTVKSDASYLTVENASPEQTSSDWETTTATTKVLQEVMVRTRQKLERAEQEARLAQAVFCGLLFNPQAMAHPFNFSWGESMACVAGQDEEDSGYHSDF